MKLKLKSLVLVLLASALLTGCAIATFTYQDAPPTPVQFESMKAEQTFYNAVLVKYFPAFDNRSKGSYGEAQLALPVEYEHDIRKSSNVIFNEAVAVADANHDGIITESEAQTYAATMAARTDEQKEEDALSDTW